MNVSETNPAHTMLPHAQDPANRKPGDPSWTHPQPGEVLVGREDELGSLAPLMTDPEVGWVTLLGPGGIGKSLLAREAASRAADAGIAVRWVDLHAAASPDDAWSRLLEATPPPETEHPTLLVLDGLERVASRVERLTEWFVHRPGQKVLATSRVATSMSFEYQVPVRPLAIDSPTTETGIPPAQALFLRHARRYLPPDELKSEYQLVTDICVRLGGFPLALIVAASQLGTLNLSSLRARVGDGLAPWMLGPSNLPARQASLATAVGGSVEALGADDQALLGALSVFRGPFTLPWAAALIEQLEVSKGWPSSATVEDAVFQAIRRLTLNSLLSVAHDSSPEFASDPRFLMPSVVRDTVRGRPQAQDLQPHLSAAHAQLILANVSEGRDDTGPASERWLARLDVLLDDARAALAYLLAEGDSTALVIVAGMRNYWLYRGLVPEGLRWVDEALSLDAADEIWRTRAIETRGILTGAASSYANALADLELAVQSWEQLGDGHARARALVGLAAAQFEVEGFPRALPTFEEAIRLLDGYGDRWWASFARSVLGATAASTGEDREFALRTLDSAIAGLRSTGDSLYTNVPLQQLGRMLHEEGNDSQALVVLEESLSLARAADDPWNASISLNLLAHVDLARSRPINAAERFLDSLEMAARMGAKPRFIWCLEGLALCLAEINELPYAARLIGLASTVRAELGLQDWVELPARSLDLSVVSATLNPGTYQRALLEGARTSVGDVLVYLPTVLAQWSQAREQHGPGNPSGLTNREVEVLQLIATGATSKAIASQLFISIETVGRHISNLYRKIGVSGRAEATAFALRSGLADSHGAEQVNMPGSGDRGAR